MNEGADMYFPNNILLVDDEEDLLEIIGGVLSDSGYRVQTASTGERGVNTFRQGRIDVVVSDVKMPGIDGIEMIRRIKQADPFVVPIVMTALHDQETAVRAMASGVKRFLVKPFSPEELIAQIQEALEERKAMVESLNERKRMEEGLIYAERLSMLGQLAPRIAHEFKTPLQLISGYAELALEVLRRNRVEEVYSYLGNILPVVRQMAGLVQQMSDLGRPTETRWETLDLRVEAEDALQVMRHLGAVKHCKTVQAFDDPLPHIQGDSGQIRQVFQNLIVNAAHAMERSRRKVLTVSLKASPDGGRVEATVEDTGEGIPTENLARIFDPFFTTKPEGKGTGLGLPIVKTILERHRATLRVESEVGAGARFIASFPATP
jgi:signal transduction histidine kinase